ncbi:MAG: class I SAM-dependent methyltransferase [Comamonas sp.]
MGHLEQNLVLASGSGVAERVQGAIDSLQRELLALKAALPCPPALIAPGMQSLAAAHRSTLDGLQATLQEFQAAVAALTAREREQLHPQVMARLHPLVLESPFARRCLQKPLGYAGDYVMVRHILEDLFPGTSAYAQLVTFLLLDTDVARGHRNRINTLEALIHRHADMAAATGRMARGLTIGCGPAYETLRFIQSSAHAESLALTLLDFDQETLEWTAQRLARECAGSGKRPELIYVKASVQELARKTAAAIAPSMDFVICAGLLDYLTDGFCKRVIEFGMRCLAPGGTLLVTNVSQSQMRLALEEILEWNLVYRTPEQLEQLIPRTAGFSHRIYMDATGTNALVEVTRQ